MWRLFSVVVLVAVVVGGGYLYLNYQIKVDQGEDGVQCIKITPQSGQQLLPGWSSEKLPAKPPRPAIRIATFNLTRLDENKLAYRQVNDILVHVISCFDIVALQAVQGKNQVVLLRLIEQINAAGREYDFAVCRGAVREPVEQYSAFLFDRAGIEIDTSLAQQVDDPQRRFRHKPLVASFRVRGPDTAQAFTFTLINVHVDPARAAAELDLLDDVHKAVRDDRQNEDDIILLGDFAAASDHLGQLGQVPDITSSITDTPTTLRGGRPVDNILFNRRATTEYTGRSGVLDLMREFDLTFAAALEVSEHLPVWAEFHSYEGAQHVHLPEETDRRTR